MAADDGALPSAAGGAVYTWNSSSRFLRVIGCITITDGSDSVKYWEFIADKLSAASWDVRAILAPSQRMHREVAVLL